jgi:hypothetical protein
MYNTVFQTKKSMKILYFVLKIIMIPNIGSGDF